MSIDESLRALYAHPESINRSNLGGDVRALCNCSYSGVPEYILWRSQASRQRMIDLILRRGLLSPAHPSCQVLCSCASAADGQAGRVA